MDPFDRGDASRLKVGLNPEVWPPCLLNPEVLSESGANEVFDAFLGRSRPALDPMTDLDRSFAQALYVEAFSASNEISHLSCQTASGAGSELISLPHVAMELANYLGARGNVNVTIMRKMRGDWRAEYISRAHNGEYVSYEK